MDSMMQTTTNMLRTPTAIIENTYNLYCNPKSKQRLAADFEPGPYDVICARGKKAHDHEGNVRFRAMVEQHQEEYKNCTSKHEKSKIVSYIVNTVRTQAKYHNGGFVKNIEGLWYEVGDRAAKEKIGQTFRDLLHTKYSSSTKAKARVRVQRRVDEYNQQQGISSADDASTPPQSPQRQPQRQPHPLSNNHLPQAISIPLTVPSLRQVKESTASLFTSFTSRSSKSSSGGGGGGSVKKRNNKRMSLVNRDPDKPLTDSILLDTLRDSVQTVDMPANVVLPNESIGEGGDWRENDWMRMSGMSVDSALTAPSIMKSSTISRDGLSASVVDGIANQIIQEQDIDDIVNTYMTVDASTTSTGTARYGVFSSSTKGSNPFLSSIKVEDLHQQRREHPLKMSSVGSSFMSENMDGLLDSFGSMSLMNIVED